MSFQPMGFKHNFGSYRAELLEILNFAKARDRHMGLKSFYSDVVDCISIADGCMWQQQLRDAYNKSPITGPLKSKGNGLINMKRCTLKELKDFVSWEVLASLLLTPLSTSLFKPLTFDTILEAIANPTITGGDAKCGYRFGWPTDLLRDIEDYRSTVEHSMKSYFDLSRLIEPSSQTTPSTTTETNTMEISSLNDAVLAVAQNNIGNLAKDHYKQWGSKMDMDGMNQTQHVLDALNDMASDLDADQVSSMQTAYELRDASNDMPDLINGPTVTYPNEVFDLVEKHMKIKATEPAPIDLIDLDGGVVAASEPTNDVVVDPSFAPMVNAVMGQVTGGKFNNIEDMVKTFNASIALNNQAADQITDLKTKLSSSATNVARAPVEPIDGVTTKMVMVKANTKFSGPNGAGAKALDFEVPSLIHCDPQGNEVKHHLVPEIDTKYVWRMKLLLKVLIAIKNGDNSWLHGHTGTGKSTFIEQVAAVLNWPLIRVNLDGNIERADLTGERDVIEENGTSVTVFAEGILPQAMQQPCLLLLDEIDFGRADVMYVIQRALEGNGLMLTEDKGRMVMPHQFFRFIATGNTKGQGDEWGCYQGARVLSTATTDRFTSWIHVPYLETDDEIRLLKASVPAINDNVAAQFVDLAKHVRTGFIGGELGTTLSPRGLMAMARYYVDYEAILPSKAEALELAIEVTLIDKMPDDNKQAVINIKNSVFEK